MTTGDDRTILQALSLINDCNKYKMDLTTNGVVITDAIKFVKKQGENTMSAKEENEKESKEPDYDDGDEDGEDKDQLEEKQEAETGEIEQETPNQVL